MRIIRRLLLVTGAVAALVSLLGVTAPSAHAKACGDVSAQGQVWIVGGAGATCTFQRKWARGYLNHGATPKNWTCRGRFRGSGGCDKNASNAFFVFYPPD